MWYCNLMHQVVFDQNLLEKIHKKVFKQRQGLSKILRVIDKPLVNHCL